MKRQTERKHLAEKRYKARKRAKIITIVCVAVAAVLLAGAAGFGVYVSGSDTIYPKVSVNGTDVGGMTADEAAAALSAAGWGEGDKTVTVELPLEHTLTVNAADVALRSQPGKPPTWPMTIATAAPSCRTSWPMSAAL